MCGRYTLTTELFRIKIHFGAEIDREVTWNPRYNIAPTQLAPILIADGNVRRLKLARFGLIPHWAKDDSIASKLINARSETVWEKPSFRDAIRRRRCAIPTDGFYEWKQLGGKRKQPYRILPQRNGSSENGLFAFAGIYDSWTSPGGEIIDTFSILTREANEDVRALHDRMPVILPPELDAIDRWLDPRMSDPQSVQNYFTRTSEPLSTYPVSDLVNAAKNDNARCIEELERTSDLFSQANVKNCEV